MAVTKAALTEVDIQSLKNKKKNNSKMRITISLISTLSLLMVYLIVGFDTSNSFFRFFAGAVILINSALILKSLIDTNYDNDLSEKQKYVGTVKVKKKEYWYDNEDNSEIFMINFDEWRIGNKSFKEEIWNTINEGDEFYVEQATNSGFLIKLEKDNVDFKAGLAR
ncbi:hypothetical protein GKZ90_0008950 [Flavobacterium sp. MC2016-06]|uniref:hypothetical protein n=1 Tax=Flavobacterium sp. MC2016-06 TaxID=2676308 RepID=UPI0012BAA584|nr:hypothetical protein [Flavobacterium sp. MC2016-06]MBU3859409.1 hypothetical protein [Flavobacterium sp. MC2016-06]